MLSVTVSCQSKWSLKDDTKQSDTNSSQQPVEQLSKERPQPNIFNTYIIGSVLGQFAIHIVTLIYISDLAQTPSPKDPNFDPDAETDFEPSLLNSAIYLLQLIQQVSTFAVNYQGRPFRESIRENRGMFYGIVFAFKLNMVAVMLVDFVGCWAIERGLKALYSDFRPKDIALRRPDQLVREQERKRAEMEALEKEKEKGQGDVKA